MLNKNYYELLSTHFPAWTKLTKTQQQIIIDNATLISIDKNALIQNTQAGCSGVLIIKEGTLRVYTLSEQGKEITLYRKDITFDIYIDTLTKCELIQILPCAFSRVMQENIYLEALTYKLATQRLCTVTWAMQQMIFTSFDRRLAEFLLNESHTINSDTINMTHEQDT